MKQPDNKIGLWLRANDPAMVSPTRVQRIYDRLNELVDDVPQGGASYLAQRPSLFWDLVPGVRFVPMAIVLLFLGLFVGREMDSAAVGVRRAQGVAAQELALLSLAGPWQNLMENGGN